MYNSHKKYRIIKTFQVLLHTYYHLDINLVEKNNKNQYLTYQ